MVGQAERLAARRTARRGGPQGQGSPAGLPGERDRAQGRSRGPRPAARRGRAQGQGGVPRPAGQRGQPRQVLTPANRAVVGGVLTAGKRDASGAGATVVAVPAPSWTGPGRVGLVRGELDWSGASWTRAGRVGLARGGYRGSGVTATLRRRKSGRPEERCLSPWGVYMVRTTIWPARMLALTSAPADRCLPSAGKGGTT